MNRMTDEQLAELTLWVDDPHIKVLTKELVAALKAERERVAELEEEISGYKKANRWNIDVDNERLIVCRGEHYRDDNSEHDCWDHEEVWVRWSLLEAAEARINCLEDGYREAIADIGDWAEYATDYFKTKHDLSGVISSHCAILNQSKEERYKAVIEPLTASIANTAYWQGKYDASEAKLDAVRKLIESAETDDDCRLTVNDLKAAILVTLKAGKDVPGAVLGKSQESLRIK